ncbi:glycosyltransferase family 25 protein [Georgenia muralis]
MARQLRTHIINLPDDHERLGRALSRARTVGLDPQVFAGLRPKNYPDLSVASDALTAGEVGCFLSHRTLIDRIVEADSGGGDSIHLILEDDVVFFDGFSSMLQPALATLVHRQAAILQLGWLPTTESSSAAALWWARAKANRGLRSAAHALWRSIPVAAPPVTGLQPGWGTHCYAVMASRIGEYRDFLDGRALAPVDYYLRAFSELRPGAVLRTRFPLAGQDWNFDSRVRPDRFNHQLAQIGPDGRRLREPVRRSSTQ